MKRLDFLLKRDFTGHRLAVAVAMAESTETMECISALRPGLVDFVLIGDLHSIQERAKQAGVDTSTFRLVEAHDEVSACRTAARLVAEGQAHTLMKGFAQTSTFTKSILDKDFNLVADGRHLSHVAVFDVAAYHKLLIVTDAGINIDPNLEEKCAILDNAIEVARRIGTSKPKVACVAPTEKVNPKIRSTVDASKIKELAEGGRFGDASVDGPMGLDIAVSTRAATEKAASGIVAGDPDILLLPNLEAANVMYKSLTELAGAEAAGVLTGAKMPIILTSRSDTERTKLLSLHLAFWLLVS